MDVSQQKRDGKTVVKIVAMTKTASLDCGKIVAMDKPGINESKKGINHYK